MKRWILILAVIASCYTVSAQTEERETIYCEIVGTANLLGKISVTIDMGEDKGTFNLNTSYIIDESTGKAKKFNSMVDAMNFMGKKGWKFEQAYIVTSGNTNVYHFLLSQEIVKGADGNYYPATKKAFNNK